MRKILPFLVAAALIAGCAPQTKIYRSKEAVELKP